MNKSAAEATVDIAALPVAPARHRYWGAAPDPCGGLLRVSDEMDLAVMEMEHGICNPSEPRQLADGSGPDLQGMLQRLDSWLLWRCQELEELHLLAGQKLYEAWLARVMPAMEALPDVNPDSARGTYGTWLDAALTQTVGLENPQGRVCPTEDKPFGSGHCLHGLYSAHSPERFIALLRERIARLRKAASVWWPESSGDVTRKEGRPTAFDFASDDSAKLQAVAAWIDASAAVSWLSSWRTYDLRWSAWREWLQGPFSRMDEISTVAVHQAMIGCRTCYETWREGPSQPSGDEAREEWTMVLLTRLSVALRTAAHTLLPSRAKLPAHRRPTMATSSPGGDGGGSSPDPVVRAKLVFRSTQPGRFEIGREGQTRLFHLKGFAYLYELVCHEGRPIPAIHLALQAAPRHGVLSRVCPAQVQELARKNQSSSKAFGCDLRVDLLTIDSLKKRLNQLEDEITLMGGRDPKPEVQKEVEKINNYCERNGLVVSKNDNEGWDIRRKSNHSRRTRGKLGNTPADKARIAVRSAVQGSILALRPELSEVADALEAGLKFGREIIYENRLNIYWETI
jgi:hypothetical protein